MVDIWGNIVSAGQNALQTVVSGTQHLYSDVTSGAGAQHIAGDVGSAVMSGAQETVRVASGGTAAGLATAAAIGAGAAGAAIGAGSYISGEMAKGSQSGMGGSEYNAEGYTYAPAKTEGSAKSSEDITGGSDYTSKTVNTISGDKPKSKYSGKIGKDGRASDDFSVDYTGWWEDPRTGTMWVSEAQAKSAGYGKPVNTKDTVVMVGSQGSYTEGGEWITSLDQLNRPGADNSGYAELARKNFINNPNPDSTNKAYVKDWLGSYARDVEQSGTKLSSGAQRISEYPEYAGQSGTKGSSTNWLGSYGSKQKMHKPKPRKNNTKQINNLDEALFGKMASSRTPERGVLRELGINQPFSKKNVKPLGKDIKYDTSKGSFQTMRDPKPAKQKSIRTRVSSELKDLQEIGIMSTPKTGKKKVKKHEYNHNDVGI